MTSRGNQSVSPTAQISQSRHVNSIPSSTPPPQQYFQGASSTIQPGAYAYLSQATNQPFLQYPAHAYGSSINDIRGHPGGGGRAGPTQQNLPQGGTFFSQHGPNTRPQQIQQPPVSNQQYYIGPQTQNAMVRPPQHQPSPQMMYVQPTNSVIMPAMYQSHPVPIYQQSPYVPNPAYQASLMYYQNGTQWRSQGMGPVATPQIQPLKREKKVLQITDPNTGRNVMEDVMINRAHAAEIDDQQDQTAQGKQRDKEICQDFARKVAESLKSPDDSGVSGLSSDSLSTISSGQALPPTPGQQYQQSSSSQHQIQQQQQPQTPIPRAQAPVMRPPMSGPPPSLPHQGMPPRPGLIQHPPTTGTPPSDIPPHMLDMDLSRPPPQYSMHQPAPQPAFNPSQQPQHPSLVAHHQQSHPQQQQQHHTIRPQLPPLMPQQMQIQSPPLHQSPPYNQIPTPDMILSPSNKAEVVIEKPALLTEVIPASNIPGKPTPPPVPAQDTRFIYPAKDSTIAPAHTDQTDDSKPATPSAVKTAPLLEEIHIIKKTEEKTKEETVEGVSSPTVKDGSHKSKKNKKSFTHKDVSGSDMDAFMDNSEERKPEASESGITRTNNALDIETKVSYAEGVLGTELDTGYEAMSQLTENKELAETKEIIQPLLEPQLLDMECTLEKDTESSQKQQENQKQSSAPVQVQNDTAETQSKPSANTVPLDSKPALEDNLPTEAVNVVVEEQKVIAEVQKVITKDALQPQPVVAESREMETKQEVDGRTPASTHKQDKIVKNAATIDSKTTNIAASKAPAHQVKEEPRIINPSLFDRLEKREPPHMDNGLPDDVLPEPVVKSELSAVSSNHLLSSDDGEPQQEEEDFKRGQTNESFAKSSGKTVHKFKDGKEKLQYDRNYLMELRECPSSQVKPEGLPELEIILDRPVISSNRGTGSTPLDFTPAFFQPTGSQRPQIGKTNSRNRQRPDVQMPQRVIKGVSLQDSAKSLHQSENPWKPTPKQLSAGEIAEKRKSLESEVLFIMNRLTPTNFERLKDEMCKLNIEAYDDLQELVKIFFDKVTMETKFVEAYAQLCKVMSSLRVAPPPGSAIKENQATFRVVMLTKCQQEFEADKTTIFEDPEEKRKKIESEMPDTPERATLIENTLYQMKLKRLKFYGNIRFIGELFKLNMLTENIMHDCIYRLLKAKDDDSLLSLCNLITTVGQNLDTEKAKPRMDSYFLQMGKIAEEQKSRIKFTLKDVIDLRNNNWIPRKEQTGPKKIDEVHKDFQQEQATKQFLQSQPMPPRNETPQPNSRRGSRQRQDDKQPVDDGWNTVGSKSLRIDASKMKLSKNVVDENSIQLGPGGLMKSMWSRGSFGGAQPSQDNERPPAANRFSALRGDEDRRSFQRSPSRGDSGANRGMRQGPPGGAGRGKILARSSREGERREALANARTIVGGGRSQNSSRDNSWNREDRRPSTGPRGSREGENPMTRSEGSLRPNSSFLMPPPAVSPPPSGAPAGGYDDDHAVRKLKPLSQEEMEQKAKTILEEYLSVLDIEEAKLCLMELAHQEHLPALVTACINEVLEKSNKERDLTGSFFHEMIRNGLLSQDVYIKGLTEVLQFAEDMVIDIPKMWTYLAQLMVPVLLGGSVPWPTLASAFKSCLDKHCCPKLIAEILIIAKDKTNENEVALLWQSSQMDWKSFLDSEDVPHFLKDKKLEFTLKPVSSSGPAVASNADLQRITHDIESIIRRNGSKDEIFAYVAKHGHAEKHGKLFIRALVTAVANVSISAPAMKFSESVIKNSKDVLQNYIKNNPEMELQALFAVQALMCKLEHPSAVIAGIFFALCEEDVISEDAFKRWEKSDHPQEQEGKGTCIMQLTQFFTWLRENEETETS